MFKRKRQVKIAIDFHLASATLLIMLILLLLTMLAFVAFVDHYNGVLAFKPTPTPPNGVNNTAPNATSNQQATAAPSLNNTNRTNATSLGAMICHYIPQNKSLLCHMA
jgi:hypothetical protein